VPRRWRHYLRSAVGCRPWAAVILTGQNIDHPWMQTVLAGGTPKVC
jgi:hypothetical protein